MAHSTSARLKVLVLVSYLLVSAIHCRSNQQSGISSKKYLLFAFGEAGSHFDHLSHIGNALVSRGHKVTFLFSSSQPMWKSKVDASLFSSVEFNSSVTPEERVHVWSEFSRSSVNGKVKDFWVLPSVFYWFVRGKRFLNDLMLDDCDALLGDSKAMAKLRRERVDMLIADDVSKCNPLLAQALGIPFILSSNKPMMMSDDYAFIHGVPKGFPEMIETTGTVKRIKSVLDQMGWMLFHYIEIQGYQRLKMKYNIKQEVDMIDSLREFKFWFFNGNFPLESPRYQQPNTLSTAPITRSTTDQKIEDDVMQFLDNATNGVVLFTFGTYVNFMARQQAQMIADALALVPQRVLWQTKADLSTVIFGGNTKIVKWVPLAQIMNHDNVKVFVCHGGINGLNEAIMAGLPIVGIPLCCDQIRNVDRVVARGLGLSVDINTVEARTLSDTINKVATLPMFRESVTRDSRILRDLTTSFPPIDAIVEMILHVTEFGADHLRPEGTDLNFVQRNFLDVCGFLLLVLILVVFAVAVFIRPIYKLLLRFVGMNLIRV